jgi:hypothetical protein
VRCAQAGGVPVLVEALRRAQGEGLCVAVLQCIANVAEDLAARAALNELDVLVTIRQLQGGCLGPLLERATAQAAAAVSFKHVSGAAAGARRGAGLRGGGVGCGVCC